MVKCTSRRPEATKMEKKCHLGAPRRHQATHQASQPASRPQNEPKSIKKEYIFGCCFSLFGYFLLGSSMVFF